MKRISIPDHNRLQATATQLEADGNTNARDYARRYREAQKAYDHVVAIGGSVKAASAKANNYFVLGCELADLLVQNGWTPPAPIEVVNEPDAVEAEGRS